MPTWLNQKEIVVIKTFNGWAVGGDKGANAASGGTGSGGSAGANRAMQVGSFRPNSGMDNGGARGSFLEKINRRGLNQN